MREWCKVIYRCLCNIYICNVFFFSIDWNDEALVSSTANEYNSDEESATPLCVRYGDERIACCNHSSYSQ